MPSGLYTQPPSVRTCGKGVWPCKEQLRGEGRGASGAARAAQGRARRPGTVAAWDPAAVPRCGCLRVMCPLKRKQRKRLHPWPTHCGCTLPRPGERCGEERRGVWDGAGGEAHGWGGSSDVSSVMLHASACLAWHARLARSPCPPSTRPPPPSNHATTIP